MVAAAVPLLAQYSSGGEGDKACTLRSKVAFYDGVVGAVKRLLGQESNLGRVCEWSVSEVELHLSILWEVTRHLKNVYSCSNTLNATPPLGQASTRTGLHY